MASAKESIVSNSIYIIVSYLIVYSPYSPAVQMDQPLQHPIDRALWTYVHTLPVNDTYFVKVYRHVDDITYYMDVYSTWVRQPDCTELIYHVIREDTDVVYYFIPRRYTRTIIPFHPIP